MSEVLSRLPLRGTGRLGKDCRRCSVSLVVGQNANTSRLYNSRADAYRLCYTCRPPLGRSGESSGLDVGQYLRLTPGAEVG